VNKFNLAKNVSLLYPSHSLSTQATADSVCWQLCPGMDLDEVHQEDTQAAQSMISGFWTVYVNIIVYFFLVLFSHGAFFKYLVFLVLIVTIFQG
jgi:hypothetical protein